MNPLHDGEIRAAATATFAVPGNAVVEPNASAHCDSRALKENHCNADEIEMFPPLFCRIGLQARNCAFHHACWTDAHASAVQTDNTHLLDAKIRVCRPNSTRNRFDTGYGNTEKYWLTQRSSACADFSKQMSTTKVSSAPMALSKKTHITPLQLHARSILIRAHKISRDRNFDFDLPTLPSSSLTSFIPSVSWLGSLSFC